jgi:hypothetical protein
MNQGHPFSFAAGDRPEAATQHAPATAGALLDAHASLLRAASALCSHPPAEYPPAARAAVSRIASAATMGARDIGVVLVELRRGEP